jgi:hypothetical protein
VLLQAKEIKLQSDTLIQPKATPLKSARTWDITAAPWAHDFLLNL